MMTESGYFLLQPTFWSNPTCAIMDAYLQTDASILEESAKLGTGGSTALTAIVISRAGSGVHVHDGGCAAYVANVGDSRAVLCRSGTAVQVTVDHDPVTERSSVQRNGGFITTLPGFPSYCYVFSLMLSHI